MPLRNIFFIALSAIICLACYSVASKNRYANLFAEAMNLIETEALYVVPPEKLFDSAMDGMMEELDDHSRFISGDDFRAFDEDMRQEFGGVGMYVDNDPKAKRLIVLAPIPNSPAFKAGIKIGDVILEIDGESTDGMSRTDAIKKMRGPKNKPVDILIGRKSEKIPLTLTRAAIPVPSVHGDWRNEDGTWNFVLQDAPNIGYIRLIQFGDRSTTEMLEAIEKVNDKVDGLIIDLRNNSGGLLNSAIDISDMFLEGDLAIVRTRGRNGVLRPQGEYFSTAGVKLNPGIPIVMLVNRHSASASEILSACLQDHGRAVIIGEQTWGKGTVQNVVPMQRDQSALKLTTASYWRPSGANIDRNDELSKQSGKWGVQPDPGFEISLTEEEVFENIRARSRRELAGLGGDVSRNDPEETGDTPDAAGANKPELVEQDGDKPAVEGGEDGGAENAKAKKPVVPHVDRPMKRAREYFQKLFSKAAAA